VIDLHALASERNLKATLDPSAEGEPRSDRPWLWRIPCKYGWIGVHGPATLLAHCNAKFVIPRLLAIPGVVARQRGDREVNATVPPERLDEVAELLQTRKQRRLNFSDEERARRASLARNLRSQTQRRPQIPAYATTPVS
jgi:hypothetical protein